MGVNDPRANPEGPPQHKEPHRVRQNLRGLACWRVAALRQFHSDEKADAEGGHQRGPKPGFGGFWWVLAGFGGLLAGFIGFYRVLSGFIGFYRVLSGFIRFYPVFILP